VNEENFKGTVFKERNENAQRKNPAREGRKETLNVASLIGEK